MSNTKDSLIESLDLFTKNYLIAALWSSVDDDGQPFDDNYDLHDLTCEALKQAKADCKDFQKAHRVFLLAAQKIRPDYGLDTAGIDFWLTRNHHGAGFWDRGLGEVGTQLTEACRPYGSCDLYVTTMGQVGMQ